MRPEMDPSVVMVFVDGLGIGRRDPAMNPLARFEGKVLALFQDDASPPLPRQGRCLPTDACLGVAGLPQSATGQATLFTGENAAGRLGIHLPGFPNRTLREMISCRSLFRRLREHGLEVTFANTYAPTFFERRPRWVSVTTVMCETAEVPLRRMEDLTTDRGLYFDFTNGVLRRRGWSVARRTPEEAAAVLGALSRDFHLTLYEYFLTDLVGHRGDIEEATEVVRLLDRFLDALVRRLDLRSTSLVVCSDHGNLEDKTVRTHTRNPVPTLLWGEIQDCFPETNDTLSLTEITPRIVRYLTEERRRDRLREESA